MKTKTDEEKLNDLLFKLKYKKLLSSKEILRLKRDIKGWGL